MAMRLFLFLIGITSLFGTTVPIQPVARPGTTDVRLESRVNAFGETVHLVRGLLVNNDDVAYDHITVDVTLRDPRGDSIGAGFGFPVTACGAGMLPSFTMQPGDTQLFEALISNYEAGAALDGIDVNVLAEPHRASDTTAVPLPTGIQQLASREVVAVEWIDATHLRYGAGCYRDLFTDYNWFELDIESGREEAITHPRAEFVNDRLWRTIDIDPQYIPHSAIRFEPNGSRFIFQNHLNAVFTAEANGDFIRGLYDTSVLGNRTLQGIHWLGDGYFVAYYFGAYGDDVLYYTANIDGTRVSGRPTNLRPSRIVPGATPDGESVVIAATIDDVPGYYLASSFLDRIAPLFEADPPGNNWPPPLVVPLEVGSVIYIARPVNGDARLQCYNLATRHLNDLSALPLRLTSSDRAVWASSPDKHTIALAANGVDGGLWRIRLDELPPCE